MADKYEREESDFSLTEPKSARPGDATTHNRKADAETFGEASGGFLGAVGGMAVGAAGGPVGLVLGGIAGALGGWWAGHGIAGAVTADDEATFRTHYEASPDRLADRGYEEVRPAYVAGYLAGRNPEYAGRSFDEIEGDLRHGWSDEVVSRSGDWQGVRGYARTAFDRARGTGAPERGAKR